MELTLKANGFQELSLDEMQAVDGGIDWNGVGGTLSTAGGAYLGTRAGAYIGAQIGCVGGPAGAVIGGIVGAAAGYILYSLWD